MDYVRDVFEDTDPPVPPVGLTVTIEPSGRHRDTYTASVEVDDDARPPVRSRFQEVLEGRPVVFLDACDTSRARTEDGGDDDAGAAGVVARAQGLAAAFVYAGAHACVGSLWPVFDDSAQAFAASFYESLFRRDRIGDALSEARCRSRTASTDRLTWASYALYGDPLHRLRDAPRPPAHQAPTTPPG